MLDLKQIDLSDFDLDSKFVNDENLHEVNGGALGLSSMVTSLVGGIATTTPTPAGWVAGATAAGATELSCNGTCGSGGPNTNTCATVPTTATSWQ